MAPDCDYRILLGLSITIRVDGAMKRGNFYVTERKFDMDGRQE